MNGFSPVELTPPTFLQRLAGKGPKEDAFAEIQNLLSRSSIREISPDEVPAILGKYGLDLALSRDRLKALYATALHHFAQDAEVTEAEADDLRRLRHLFGLSEADVQDTAKVAYRDAFQEVVQDRLITPEEKVRLETSKVIDFTVYSDGLSIQKETGKDQVFLFDGGDSLEVERWGVMLKAALLADRA